MHILDLRYTHQPWDKIRTNLRTKLMNKSKYLYIIFFVFLAYPLLFLFSLSFGLIPLDNIDLLAKFIGPSVLIAFGTGIAIYRSTYYASVPGNSKKELHYHLIAFFITIIIILMLLVIYFLFGSKMNPRFPTGG